MKIYIPNTYHYSMSHYFCFAVITKIYAIFFKALTLLKFTIYYITFSYFILEYLYQYNLESDIFYLNHICIFSDIYFLIPHALEERRLFISVVFILLLFLIPTLILIRSNLFISKIRIYLFRGLSLLSFYISFINSGCGIDKIKIN